MEHGRADSHNLIPEVPQEAVIAVNELVMNPVNVHVFSVLDLPQNKETVVILLLKIKSFHQQFVQFRESVSSELLFLRVFSDQVFKPVLEHF